MSNQMHSHPLHPHIKYEREMWETIRVIGMKKGRVHPACRYSNWEAFVEAGFPWHNHGESGFADLSLGDSSRKWEAQMQQEILERRESSRNKPLLDPAQVPSGGYGFCNIREPRGVRSMVEEIIQSRATGHESW